ncbi:dolichyl-diphosphooligosaccharide--protein glycosyltransferase subunit 2 [Neocloeon triangulifer]|uniref:dolichyl-diphosphooligosaccharide--protein glycosyltransferase subunit 2 n=1 Tax=Neocloeon triangulifer TaxID=2078957 RepID=UPI00286EF652|nr:dolichyl-diphosphooligosaccharide--protein glycosyltransferase subunit 2 [Neocloeon triangulifer]
MRAVWVVLLGLSAVVVGLSTTDLVTPADRLRLKTALLGALDSNDITAVHYSVLGLGLLNEKPQKTDVICKLALSSATATGANSAPVLYHVVDTWKVIGNCPGSLPTNIAKDLSAALESEDSSIPNLYFAYQGLISLGQKPKDISKLAKNLQTAIKKDDSLLNLGYLFHLAALMGPAGKFAFDRIEDAIVQADEVDGKVLQFEGGISITALLVSGAYKLAAANEKKPPISGDQATKFANFFVSRKSVQSPKGVFSLLEVLHTMTSNKFHQPVVVTLASAAALTAATPQVSVRVSDLLGRSLGPLTVTLDTATRQNDGVVEMAKVALAAQQGDSTLYTLDLSSAKGKRGFYNLIFSVKPNKPDERLVGLTGAQVQVKMLGEVLVEVAELGTADADQTTAPKMNKVSYPSKANFVLEADWHQRLLMKFALKDKTTKEPITVHQAFVKLINVATNNEVIFVAEPDAGKSYRFDLDIGARASDFEQQSGKYRLELLVGDAVLGNSFSWQVGEVALTFTSGGSAPPLVDIQQIYKPKPEIKHLFREPEKRPPATVSTLFTGLVCVPFAILLILWARIGVNISNFPFSLYAIGFHLGLGGIFGLFGIFFLKLNMFTTLKYLLGIGAVTFLCGNKMLSKFAQNRRQR